MTLNNCVLKILSPLLAVALVSSLTPHAYSRTVLPSRSQKQIDSQCDREIKGLDSKNRSCSELRTEANKIKKNYFDKLWRVILGVRLMPALEYNCAILKCISKISNSQLDDPTPESCNINKTLDEDLICRLEFPKLLRGIQTNYSDMKIKLALATPMRTEQGSLLENSSPRNQGFKINPYPNHPYKDAAPLQPLTPAEIQKGLEIYYKDGDNFLKNKSLEQENQNKIQLPLPGLAFNQQLYFFRIEQQKKYNKDYIKILNSMPILGYLERPIAFDKNSYMPDQRDLPVLFKALLKIRDQNAKTQKIFSDEIKSFTHALDPKNLKDPEEIENKLLPLMAYTPVIHHKFLMKKYDLPIFDQDNLGFKKVSEVLLEKYESKKLWEGMNQMALAFSTGMLCAVALRTGYGQLVKLGYETLISVLQKYLFPSVGITCAIASGPAIDGYFFYDWNEQYRQTEREFFSFIDNTATFGMDDETYKISQSLIRSLEQLNDLEEQRTLQYGFLIMGVGFASSYKFLKSAHDISKELKAKELFRQLVRRIRMKNGNEDTARQLLIEKGFTTP